MVLRRPSARGREGLNDGHRRISAEEHSRAGGAGSGGRGGARPQGERMTILGIDPGAHGAVAGLLIDAYQAQHKDSQQTGADF